MVTDYNKKLKPAARILRNNMTAAERKVWNRIRLKQLKGYIFYRQKTIGNFIVDFYCPKAKIVIEIDGGQHLSTEGIEKDKVRDEFLNSHGFKVLRYSNNEVSKNIRGVVEHIWSSLPE